MKTLALALAPAAASLALAAASPASAQTAPAGAAQPGPATVYDNALGAGWEYWPWDGAEVQLAVETAGSARKPIRVEAQGYKGLYLHHAPFGTAPFTGLTMLVQSVGETGQVRIVAIRDGKPIPDKMKLVKLAPGGWTKVDVPLSALGAENGTIDGLWIQNDSDRPTPRFYVADIKFH